jgi:hypothetical protein
MEETARSPFYKYKIVFNLNGNIVKHFLSSVNAYNILIGCHRERSFYGRYGIHSFFYFWLMHRIYQKSKGGRKDVDEQRNE